jgi:DnaK suppressor protein
MTIDPKTLSELKATLMTEKENLEKSLGKMAISVDKKDGEYTPAFEDLGMDREDNATEVEQFTDNLPVEVALENKLKDILEALEKIEAGTYGICENCQQAIDLERLKITPSAKTCIQCK